VKELKNLISVIKEIKIFVHCIKKNLFIFDLCINSLIVLNYQNINYSWNINTIVLLYNKFITLGIK